MQLPWLYGRVSHIYGILIHEPANTDKDSSRFKEMGMMATVGAISLTIPLAKPPALPEDSQLFYI